MNDTRIYAYKNGDWIYFMASSGSSQFPPEDRIACASDHVSVGRLVAATFAKCKPPGAIEMSRESLNVFRPALKKFGFRSWGAYVRDALDVIMILKDEQIKFVPTLNDNGGFYVLKVDPDIILPASASEEELGEALFRALSYCEVKPVKPRKG